MALGCEPLGGTDWGAVDEAAAMDAVVRALDRGITFFDTADVYGLGRSETLLSKALGSRRHDVVIASKGGVRWSSPSPGTRASTSRDASPQYLVEAIESSLTRLRLDCLPLYYVHWPDPATPIDDTMAALDRARTQGKIRHVGVSNFSASQIEAAHACIPLAAVQMEYSLLRRTADTELLPTCRRLGLGVVAFGALAQGLLTGKYGAASRFGKNDRRGRLPHFHGAGLHRALEHVVAVRHSAETGGRTPAQIAIRWVLETPGIACAIVGAKNAAQVEDNVAACAWAMDRPEYQRLAQQPVGCGEQQSETT
ncbi:MAG: aldo/keto reductase [Vicinamibacterales bacterium]